MGSLPDEMIEEILVRSPVKSLIRFKSLSHAWNARIRTPAFAKSHMDHQENKNSTKLMMYTCDSPIISSISLRCNEVDEPAAADAVENIPHKFNPDFKHFRHKRKGLRILGSCNGLLLVVVHHPFRLCIWNPSTREYREVPSLKDVSLPVSESYGFGCASDNCNNYKVLFRKSIFGSRESLINLYSTQTNSWRRLGVIPYRGCSSSVHLVNAKLHFLLKNVDEVSVILAFDITNEEFKEVPQPDCVAGFELSIMESNGKLCLLQTRKETDSKDYVWVMKEYGVKESWTNMFSINLDILVVRVVYFSDEGQMLLNTKGSQDFSLLWYNCKNHEETILRSSPLQSKLLLMKYLPTLVSPKAI